MFVRKLAHIEMVSIARNAFSSPWLNYNMQYIFMFL